METAVIIARFQTPYLHEGHKYLLNGVQNKHHKIIIVLGVTSLSGTVKNPYDYHIREKMIKDEYPECIVLPLNDHPSDKVWSNNLDKLLKNTFPAEQFLLYGSRDSFIQYYSGSLPTEELPENGHHNSTEIRKKYSDQILNSEDFRKGMLYAYQRQYKKVFPTVDIALFRNDRKEILLGRKDISDQWRLPGGFVDPSDHSYESAALRELQEETGNIEVSQLIYETSHQVDDWRYRNESDKIITTLFSCDHTFGVARANDDLTEIRWIQLDQLAEMIEQNSIVHEHITLFEHLLNKYLVNKIDV